MSRDEFDRAMDAEWRRRSKGVVGWTALGAAIGAVVLGALGASWSAGGNRAALVIGVVAGVLLGGGIAWLLVRARARRAAHLEVAGQWARDHGWDYSHKVDVPAIDLAFLRQGDRRYCEDGASGMLGGHPAVFANFTVETDTTDSDGSRQTNYERFFIAVVHRAWQGPQLTMVRRSLGLGRGIRNAVRSAATGRQVVDVENDAFAKDFQVTIPDAWARDVVFLLIPPDMQEQLVAKSRLDGVRQVTSDPAFLFLAWRHHFSADDLPLLERRLDDAAWLEGRWRDIPLAMRPLEPGEGD